MATGRNYPPDVSGGGIPLSVDTVLRMSPFAAVGDIMGQTLRGINHRLEPAAVQKNRDFYGYTFFTRPMLNMTQSNLDQSRSFVPLLTREKMSIPAYIRATLDPALVTLDPSAATPLVDDRQAFIPLLTNQLVTMTGWPDIETPVFTSQEGIAKDTYVQVDGVGNENQAFTITASFRNMQGKPVAALFEAWTRYSREVFMGNLVPYPEFVYRDVIDYTTRIYRITTDSTKKYIQGIAATGYSFPVTVPYGEIFNFDVESPINSSLDSLSIQFQCVGALYNDPMLIKEFNDTSAFLFPDMYEPAKSRNLTKIPPTALDLFNHSGYPHINVDTSELEWYIPTDEYRDKVPLIITADSYRTLPSNTRLETPP